ncbi:MAG: radical SAM family heme chaperone HemW [Nitrospirae bacterium]|nr:radical SAM family heme chaperone HemW [Nitrospirota bacterium]
MSPSLYVHIPFCLKRCIYCDFVSGIYNPARADIYIEALKKEISNISNEKPISTLFIGGGTPTALSANALSDLINHIFTHFSFTENYEATIEANPGTLDKEKLQALRSSGINRLSIGIQSFNDNELSFLGRIHTSGEAEQAVHLAKESGFENVGIDLIYGIPGQSFASWMVTLEKAVSLKPKHISTYELTVEEGTLLYGYLKNPPTSPFSKGGESSLLWQRGARGDFSIKTLLPDEDKIIEMYEHTIDYLTADGYSHYEISNFAMPGYQCRHNITYWNRGEYCGAGPGAHSFINGKRFHNTDDLDEYLKLVSENMSPVNGSETITEDMALSEALFLGLRKTGGVNVEAFSRRYNKNILSHYQQEIDDLREAGLLEVASSDCSYETTLRLTRKGLVLSNEVFTKFI